MPIQRLCKLYGIGWAATNVNRRITAQFLQRGLSTQKVALLPTVFGSEAGEERPMIDATRFANGRD